jgi:hypothetical protein
MGAITQGLSQRLDDPQLAQRVLDSVRHLLKFRVNEQRWTHRIHEH